jgi:diguanylate cyclase (GGDEF)-like protein
MSLIDSDRPLSMARRVFAVTALLLLLMLAGAGWAGLVLLQDRTARDASIQLQELSQSYARELRARLAEATATVQSVIIYDAGPGGSWLQQRTQRAESIRGVVVARPPGETAEPLGQLSASDRMALSAGSTLLIATPGKGSTQIYLVHNASIGSATVVALFELSSDWLWQGLRDSSHGGTTLAVIDSGGLLLDSSGALSGEELAQLVRERDAVAEPAEHPAPRSWITGHRAWQGTVGRVVPASVHLVAEPWSVLAYAPAPALSSALLTLTERLPWLLCVALLLAAIAAWYLSHGWELTLLELRHSLRGLADGRYERIRLGSSRDAPREVALEFNRAVGLMEERVRALNSLNDIDRLLLESGDLEQSLDAVLSLIQRITGSNSVSLALLDQDAPGHARAYIAAEATAPIPVSRISVDVDLVETLQQQRAGLTVMRCEPIRHSFLEPLRALGAEFFWLWPVCSQDQVVAILAVGYKSAPEVPPELASFGTECATRLGVALSNSARDEQLYRQAHFDALTSLPNRLLFRDRLSQELTSAAAGVQRGALLYVDLDHFKKVNDSVGHSAGDQVLTIVAQRLRSCIKDGDTVARLGGDEFTVILRNAGNPDGALRIATRIIQSLQQPVSLAGRDHFVCASIGITMFPDDGTTIDELMRNADLAMYQAKAGGRARAVFYDRQMQPMPQAAESGLYRALRRREFSLYYQPQYSLLDGKLVALEALLRWQPPRESMRFPAEFVPAAEQSGLIVDIGVWVLETACAQLATWRGQGIAPERLAMNVSVYQLRQLDFPEVVRQALERFDLPAQMLEIEITESVFADDEARSTMRQLAMLGVRLSLDDFGTGYSSLGYLRQHPVQAIKIDRSFIEDIPQSDTAATLAETIINMAHALGKVVVAEGVETSEQLEFLRARRCDMAQGFYLSHPCTVADTTELLSARQSTDLGLSRQTG